MRRLPTLKRFGLILAVPSLLLLTMASSCDDSNGSATKDQQDRARSVDEQRSLQPVHAMPYSPTRNTINAWIDQWKNPNALSFNYIMIADDKGALHASGYYILKGLPVTYCVGLTPPYDWADVPDDGSSTKEQVPAPGVDGAYYGGCDNQTVYGVDASTGTVVQWDKALNMMIRTYAEPFNGITTIPLGETTIAEAEGL